ncbi:MAG: sulfatase-like hydrolase/transferase [Promethearchaeota archaeon]
MAKPNIIFILNDHQAYYGHGKMVGGPEIKRSNFDKLGKEGVIFTRAYTSTPLCGPARRTMLNGLYPHTHGEIKNDSFIPFTEETYLQALAEQGYQNYYFGKWHAGPGTAQDLGCEGFSYPSYGNPYITPEYEKYLKEMDLPYIEVEILQSFQANLKKGMKYKPKLTVYSENAAGVMTTPKETNEAYFLAHMACKKLEELARSKNGPPFHLRINFWGPHQPYFPAKEFFDQYDPKRIPKRPNFDDDLSNKPKIYQYDHHYRISKNKKIIYPNPISWEEWQEVLACNYAQQTQIDNATGRILAKIEELGLSENTIIIWTSDHGDGLACHGGHFDKNAYMPEELVRIPMAIKFPGEIEKGQVRDELVSLIDLVPTFLDIAGTSFKTPLPGKSLLPLVKGEIEEWREDFMCETHGHFTSHVGRLIVKNHYKYIYNEGDLDELYDLEKDPWELTNLINDPGYEEILTDLKERLKKWREKTGDKVTRKNIMGRHLKGL